MPFTAKALEDGSTLYRSRLTGDRYIISNPTRMRFDHALYVNGQLISMRHTRADLIDAIEFLDVARHSAATRKPLPSLRA